MDLVNLQWLGTYTLHAMFLGLKVGKDKKMVVKSIGMPIVRNLSNKSLMSQVSG